MSEVRGKPFAFDIALVEWSLRLEKRVFNLAKKSRAHPRGGSGVHFPAQIPAYYIRGRSGVFARETTKKFIVITEVFKKKNVQFA